MSLIDIYDWLSNNTYSKSINLESLLDAPSRHYCIEEGPSIKNCYKLVESMYKLENDKVDILYAADKIEDFLFAGGFIYLYTNPSKIKRLVANRTHKLYQDKPIVKVWFTTRDIYETEKNILINDLIHHGKFNLTCIEIYIPF